MPQEKEMRSLKVNHMLVMSDMKRQLKKKVPSYLNIRMENSIKLYKINFNNNHSLLNLKLF